MDRCWLICTSCGKTIPFQIRGKCDCGGNLLVDYDLEKAARTFGKDELRRRPASMWKYRELLPVSDPGCIVTLGEGWTPLTRLPAWENKLSLAALYVKREELNPTGSFKARGFSAALSLLQERGERKVAVPSNGNAASAMAAYAASAGMEAYVFVPQDCPGLIVDECAGYGARTFLVDGFIHDAGQIIEDGKPEMGWFNVGTLREPGRVEGKKTMGLELAEQLDWKLPDVIIYPTGGGSGIIGLWRAFLQLREMGLTTGELPRLVAVQEEGCTPVVSAFSQERSAGAARTSSMPTGMRVPEPPNRHMLVSILQQSGGTAIAVTDEEIREATRLMGSCGISSSPEGAATCAALLRLRDSGWVTAADSVVLFNTSHAMKYSPYTATRQLATIRSYADFQSWNDAHPAG